MKLSPIILIVLMIAFSCSEPEEVNDVNENLIEDRGIFLGSTNDFMLGQNVNRPWITKIKYSKINDELLYCYASGLFAFNISNGMIREIDFNHTITFSQIKGNEQIYYLTTSAVPDSHYNGSGSIVSVNMNDENRKNVINSVKILQRDPVPPIVISDNMKHLAYNFKLESFDSEEGDSIHLYKIEEDFESVLPIKGFPISLSPGGDSLIFTQGLINHFLYNIPDKSIRKLNFEGYIMKVNWGNGIEILFDDQDSRDYLIYNLSDDQSNFLMSKNRWTGRNHLIITDDFSKIAYITGECLEGEQDFGCKFGSFELYIKDLLNGNKKLISYGYSSNYLVCCAFLNGLPIDFSPDNTRVLYTFENKYYLADL